MQSAFYRENLCKFSFLFIPWQCQKKTYVPADGKWLPWIMNACKTCDITWALWTLKNLFTSFLKNPIAYREKYCHFFNNFNAMIFVSKYEMANRILADEILTYLGIPTGENLEVNWIYTYLIKIFTKTVKLWVTN